MHVTTQLKFGPGQVVVSVLKYNEVYDKLGAALRGFQLVGALFDCIMHLETGRTYVATVFHDR